MIEYNALISEVLFLRSSEVSAGREELTGTCTNDTVAAEATTASRFRENVPES